ncbi:MAG TPA: hypothetical protein VFB73_04840 [Chloroflexota bacterium]|nr:hypothetical protein [Chloroflexota bacterium]
MVRLMQERFALEPDVAALTYEQLRSNWTRDGAVSREGIATLQRLDVEAGALDAAVPYEQIVDSSLLEEVWREQRR